VTYNGMGKDIWNVPFEDITLMLKVRPFLHLPCGLKDGVHRGERRTCKLTCPTSTQYFYIEQYIYQVVIVLTKISIVLLYLVSPTSNR
jgi:hypothetical protein